MSRKAADPVDVAFRAWLALDADQKRRLADVQRGFQAATEPSAAAVVRRRTKKTVGRTGSLVSATVPEKP